MTCKSLGVQQLTSWRGLLYVAKKPHFVAAATCARLTHYGCGRWWAVPKEEHFVFQCNFARFHRRFGGAKGSYVTLAWKSVSGRLRLYFAVKMKRCCEVSPLK